MDNKSKPQKKTKTFSSIPEMTTAFNELKEDLQNHSEAIKKELQDSNSKRSNKVILSIKKVILSIKKANSDNIDAIMDKKYKDTQNQLSIQDNEIKSIRQTLEKMLTGKTDETESSEEKKQQMMPLKELKGNIQEQQKRTESLELKFDEIEESLKTILKKDKSGEKENDGVSENEKIFINYKNENDKKLIDLTEDLKKLHESVNKLHDDLSVKPIEEALSAIPATKPIDIDKFIGVARQKEKENYDNDEKSITESNNIIQYWEELGKTLKIEVEKAEKDIEKEIDESRGVMTDLLFDFEDELKNSQQGLDLIGRMLKRLVDPGDQIKNLIKESEPPGSLKQISKDEWEAVIKGVKTEAEAEKTLQKKSDSVGMFNYKIVSRRQELAEKREKNIMDFLDTQVLPILDGILDGLKHSTNTFDTLKESKPEKAGQLDQWLSTYKNLQNKLIDFMKKLQIKPIKIEQGSPIDYERHKPFDVESDPEMEDEQIKEVIRDGYEYKDRDNNSKILRPAQVLVVKN